MVIMCTQKMSTATGAITSVQKISSILHRAFLGIVGGSTLKTGIFKGHLKPQSPMFGTYAINLAVQFIQKEIHVQDF